MFHPPQPNLLLQQEEPLIPDFIFLEMQSDAYTLPRMSYP